MWRLNLPGWLVVEFPDLPDLESRVGRHVGAIQLLKAHAPQFLVEIVATDADAIATHPGLRHDEHSFHGAKCSTDTLQALASRSARRLR